jgi:hypothetical protein
MPVTDIVTHDRIPVVLLGRCRGRWQWLRSGRLFLLAARHEQNEGK